MAKNGEYREQNTNTKESEDTDLCKLNFLEINRLSQKWWSCIFYLYSAPTVEEFFDGIAVTLATKPFNSPIAFPGFKPY